MDNLKPKISLIIPVFNEAKTLAGVLDASMSSGVSEMVIVDDGSTDDSIVIAEKFSSLDSRIRVVANGENLGAGASRAKGIINSSGQILVFLDSDIQNPSAAIVRKLCEPILQNRADFIMASFDNLGRVTELTAKPLLSICFPEMAFINQPLSGQFASKKEFLFPQRVAEENAMLGVLLDAHLKGARIAEVDIGEVKHTKKPIEAKRRQAANECRACIRRFLESNSLASVKRGLLDT